MRKKKVLIIIIICLILNISLIFGIIIPKVNDIKEKRIKQKELEVIKKAKVEIKFKEDLNIPFASDIKISDLIESINGKIINDKRVNTGSLGVKEVSFEFINDENIKIPYKFNINVYDNIPPLLWMGSSLSIERGDKEKIEDKIMCADNETARPHCYVEGDYDINTVGKYNLLMKAIDNSGNEASKEFVLNVYEPDPNASNNKTASDNKTYFSDIAKKYKKDNISIGIDVSGWQGEIDYQKVKDAGVEFAFIKVGGEKGIDGEYYVDSKFIRNIEGFNSVGIPVGVYIFSYAKNVKQAKEEALWVIEQIKGYKVDLPIVFDWENWGHFNEFNMSLYDLSLEAEEFIKIVKDRGYQGSTYGSKNYLEKVWLKVPGIIWLAHYNSETSYQGHSFWQICDNGIVDGVNSKVDIDIWYR